MWVFFNIFFYNIGIYNQPTNQKSTNDDHNNCKDWVYGQYIKNYKDYYLYTHFSKR